MQTMKTKKRLVKSLTLYFYWRKLSVSGCHNEEILEKSMMWASEPWPLASFGGLWGRTGNHFAWSDFSLPEGVVHNITFCPVLKSFLKTCNKILTFIFYLSYCELFSTDYGEEVVFVLELWRTWTFLMHFLQNSQKSLLMRG